MKNIALLFAFFATFTGLWAQQVRTTDTFNQATAQPIAPPVSTTDACPNISGIQDKIPTGMVVDAAGNCVHQTDWLPWILIGLGLLILAILGAVWFIRRRREEREEAEGRVDEPGPAHVHVDEPVVVEQEAPRGDDTIRVRREPVQRPVQPAQAPQPAVQVPPAQPVAQPAPAAPAPQPAPAAAPAAAVPPVAPQGQPAGVRQARVIRPQVQAQLVIEVEPILIDPGRLVFNLPVANAPVAQPEPPAQPAPPAAANVPPAQVAPQGQPEQDADPQHGDLNRRGRLAVIALFMLFGLGALLPVQAAQCDAVQARVKDAYGTAGKSFTSIVTGSNLDPVTELVMAGYGVTTSISHQGSNLLVVNGKIAVNAPDTNRQMMVVCADGSRKFVLSDNLFSVLKDDARRDVVEATVNVIRAEYPRVTPIPSTPNRLIQSGSNAGHDPYAVRGLRVFRALAMAKLGNERGDALYRQFMAGQLSDEGFVAGIGLASVNDVNTATAALSNQLADVKNSMAAANAAVAKLQVPAPVQQVAMDPKWETRLRDAETNIQRVGNQVGTLSDNQTKFNTALDDYDNRITNVATAMLERDKKKRNQARCDVAATEGLRVKGCKAPAPEKK